MLKKLKNEAIILSMIAGKNAFEEKTELLSVESCIKKNIFLDERGMKRVMIDMRKAGEQETMKFSLKRMNLVNDIMG